MRLFVMFAVLTFCHLSTEVGQESHKFTVRYVKCNASKMFVHNHTCFAKSYSRHISTINIDFKFIKPAKRIFVSQISIILKLLQIVISLQMEAMLLFKYGTIHREVMRLQRHNWCAMLEDDQKNLMFRALNNVMVDSGGPECIHDCPYSVGILTVESFICLKNQFFLRSFSARTLPSNPNPYQQSCQVATIS